MEIGTSLDRYLQQLNKESPQVEAGIISLVQALAKAGKSIEQLVRSAGLNGVLGRSGRINSHGEAVEKLDEVANLVLLDEVGQTGLLGVVGSEEIDELNILPTNGEYGLFFDPVDGSSNIDVSVGIGTIFSLYKLAKPTADLSAPLLQAGDRQVGAGYILYGSSTVLVLCLAATKVQGFTLDPQTGQYLLSHRDIQMPNKGGTYSANESYYHRWSQGVRRYIDGLKQEGPQRPYRARYIGSLVADFHRNLLKGGIFLYPEDSKAPQGKLRLLYEAAPLAYIAEKAGGRASTGTERILELVPDDVHQRVPLIIGCAEDVIEAETFIQAEKKVAMTHVG